MIKMIMALFSALKAGSELRSAAAWKNAQVIASFLTALVALAAAFGYDVHLGADDIAGGAVFIAALVNGVLVIATSKKVGLPAKPEVCNGPPATVKPREVVARTGMAPAGYQRDAVAGGVRQSVPADPDVDARDPWSPDHRTG